MTIDQFKLLRVGDRVIDRYIAGGAIRDILEIKVVRNKHGQRGLSRYCFTVTNIKQSGSSTILFLSENTGPQRFSLVVEP